MSADPSASLGSKILGLFVDVDTSPKAPTVTGMAPKAAAPVSINQQMLATLREKITSRSTAYVTLIEAAQRLASVIPDEATRMKAAFAMVSGEGIRSVASITQAIDVHIADLEGERMRFKQASDLQTNVKSAALRKQAETLATQTDCMQTEIARLQADVVKNTAQCRDLTMQADQADTEITSIAAAFDRSVDFLKADLAAKKAALSSILN
ncbi:MAG: hypothetical protein V4484_16050 [Pseudomonadota bacterium]